MTVVGIVFLCVGCAVVVLVAMFFYYNNREVALRKQAEAQRGRVKAVRDTMFKVLQEKAGVADKYRAAFEKVYPEIIAGRYGGGDGRLAMWVQEQNPSFDTRLYADVQQAVESQRQGFLTAQTRMLDLINQREQLIEQYPSKWFVRDTTPIDYTVIASADTNNVVATGVDNWTLG